MSEKIFKSGDLCWICIWDESNKKFSKISGTIIQYIKDDYVEVLAGSRIFKRNISEINNIKNRHGFLPWPFNHKEINF